MELWIRSQSKEELLKIYNVSINKDNYIIGNLISDDNRSVCDYWILGMYKSKERAIEVLDEIEKLLKPQVIYNPIVNDLTLPSDRYVVSECVGHSMDIQELSGYVYQMPIE